MHSERVSAAAKQIHASSSRTSETMATNVDSAYIWRRGDRVVITLLESVNFPTRGVLAFVLFIGTPGVSAGIAGWALGKWLLDSAQVRPGSAALCGAIISSLALLLFAPLFATVYILTQPAAEHWGIVSLTFLLLVGSAFVMWFRLAVIGAAVGWVLYRLAAHDTGRAAA